MLIILGLKFSLYSFQWNWRVIILGHYEIPSGPWGGATVRFALLVAFGQVLLGKITPVTFLELV